jgi:hypothetical protein
MKLTIHLSGIAWELAENDTITIEINDKDNLHNTISKAIPGLENYFFMISINGKRTENYSSLNTNDNILVFSPIAGG